ncbi:hypothetical protein VTI28DRAFT_2006 [Corynascus sepedonium]
MTSHSIPSSSSPPPPSFTLFRYLPPELRLQIYRHSCHPRVTTLAYLPAPQDTFRCPTRPPVLLHICRESRAEGLRIYAKCLLPNFQINNTGFDESEREGGDGGDGGDNDYAIGAGGKSQQQYFYHHPLHDTLYLPRPTPATDPLRLGYADWARQLFISAAAGAALSGVVRRLAVDYIPAEIRRPWEVYGKMCLIRGCSMLEEAYLVVSGAGASAGSGTSVDVGDLEEKGKEEQGRREVEFVDPGAGDEEIVRIMERVRESFRAELESEIGGLDAVGKDEELDPSGEFRLDLIPKTKVLST